MGGKDRSMTRLNYSRRLGWEKRETKSVFWYVAYVVFMITVMYLSLACFKEAPGKTLVGCVFLFVFSDLEGMLEEYYGGFSGLTRVPLKAAQIFCGRIAGAGLFISSIVSIMLA